MSLLFLVGHVATLHMKAYSGIEVQTRQYVLGEWKGIEVANLVKPANRALFIACVVLTGALAGAFVWAFFFLMDAGLGLLWNDGRLALSGWLGNVAPELSRGPFGVALFPSLICMLGGVVIGLYEKKTGIATEDLPDVMAKIKSTGRYE